MPHILSEPRAATRVLIAVSIGLEVAWLALIVYMLVKLFGGETP